MPRILSGMVHQNGKIQRSTERTGTVNQYVLSALHTV